jgi:hypothetical protein
MRYGSAAGIEEAPELAISARSIFARSIAMGERGFDAWFCAVLSKSDHWE